MTVVIKDVAKEAGLAISTISKYMNGGKVRGENQHKIENAIEKLGYRPNEFARGLRGSNTHTIGVIIHNFKDAFSAQLISSIEKEMRKVNYSIILCSHEGSFALEKESVEFLYKKQIDGLIIEPMYGSDDIFEAFVRSKKPVVAVDRPLDMNRFDSVTSNSMWGVYEGVEHLIAKGHRDIALITAGLNETRHMASSIDRTNGFTRAMEDYCLKVKDEWLLRGDFSFQSGYVCMKQLWSCDRPPTAVIVANYYMCMGMMKAIHELGIQVPDELSVVSVDDMIFTQICNPKLTSIGQRMEEIAQKVTAIMMRRMEGDYSDFPQNLKVHTTFIERESVRQKTPVTEKLTSWKN